MKKLTHVIPLILFMTAVIVIGFVPSKVLAQDNIEVISAQSTLSTLSAAEINAYWTEEKMQHAKPMPLPMIEGKPDTKAGTFPWVYTSYQLFPDVTKLYKQLIYRTVGKLFFTIPDEGDYVCSGSVVRAPNQDLVWTAGHCVYTPPQWGGQGWHTNFLFVPARHHGGNPFQTWGWRNAWVLTAWAYDGLLEYDMGALVMDMGGPGNNYHVQALGGLNFIANIARQQHFHARGYPAAAPFDGEHHHTCASAWVTNDQPTGEPGVDPETIGIGCDMTGGSSGGPWVVDWGTNNYINSNVSYGYVGVPDQYYGPYFGDAAQVLYDAASTD